MLGRTWGCVLHVGQREQSLREEAKDTKDFVIDRLRRSKTGCPEGEGRKRATVRVVKPVPASLPRDYHPNSVEVESTRCRDLIA